MAANPAVLGDNGIPTLTSMELISRLDSVPRVSFKLSDQLLRRLSSTTSLLKSTAENGESKKKGFPSSNYAHSKTTTNLKARLVEKTEQLPFASSMELRIMDVIMGDDPLQEGEISVEDQERKQLEEEGRKAALGITGAQRVLVEDRYNQLKQSFRVKLTELASTYQSDISKEIESFDVQWQTTSDETSQIVDFITTDKLAQISKNHFLDLKDDADGISRRRESVLQGLGKKLEEMERNRATAISELIAKLGTQIKKLNYLHPAVLTRMLQNESVAINMALLENRHQIVDYIGGLRAVNVDVDRQLAEYFSEYGQKWNKARFDFVLENYGLTMQKALNVPISLLYDSYQAKFDGSVARQVDLVGDIVQVPIKNIDLDWLNGWKKNGMILTQKQDSDIYLFRNDLIEFESKMDLDVKNLSEVWYHSFEECEIVSDSDGSLKKLMQGVVQNYRKSSEILAGKRAAMMLTSQASRNHEVLDKVGEFIVCVLATKQEHAEKMAEAELEIVTRLHELKEEATTEKGYHEKTLEREINALRSETKDHGILKRLGKCNDILKSIDDCLKSLQHQSMSVVESLDEKIQRIELHYREKMISMFKLDPILLVYADQTPQDSPEPRSLSPEKGRQSTNSMLTGTTDMMTLDTATEVTSTVRPEDSVSVAAIRPVTVPKAEERPSTEDVLDAALLVAPLEKPATAPADESAQRQYTGESSSNPLVTELSEFATPKPAVISVREIEFFSKKVSDWRNEQSALTKAKAAQIEHEHQQAKLKKLHQKKHKNEALKESTWKPTLLNGEEYVPNFKPGSYLSSVGYPEDLNVITYISDQFVELDRNIVEIVPLPISVLGLLRQHLEKAIREDADEWQATVSAAVSQKISKKLDLIATERSQQIIQYEKRVIDVDDLAKKRAQDLPHLRVSHENEANLILFKVNQLRDNYANSIKSLVNMSHVFHENIIKVVTQDIQKAPSATFIYNAQTKFQKQLVEHTLGMRQLLTTATDAFDNARTGLLKSKNVGRHSAAWAILVDSLLVDPQTLSSDLEAFRSTFDDQIEKVQTDTGNQVHHLLTMMNAFLDDYKFLDHVDQCVRQVKTHLRAEKAFAQSAQSDLLNAIQTLKLFRLDPKPKTWNDLLNALDQAEEIRIKVLKIAKYLDCLKPDSNEISFSNTCVATMDQWKSFKTEKKWTRTATRPSSSKKSMKSLKLKGVNSTKSMANTAPSRKGSVPTSSGSSGNLLSNAGSSNLLNDASVNEGLVVEESPLVAEESGEVESPEPVEKIDYQEDTDHAEPPKSPTTPVAVTSQGLSRPTSGGSAKNEGNDSKSPSPHQSMATIHLLATPTASRPVSGAATSKRGGSGTSTSSKSTQPEVPTAMPPPGTLMGSLAKWRRDARMIIYQMTDTFFEKRAEVKDVTRSDRVPSVGSHYMHNVDEILRKISGQAEVFRVSQINRNLL